MKKLLILLFTLFILFGCNKGIEETSIDLPNIDTISGDAYEELNNKISKREMPTNYSVGIISKYEFIYPDESRNSFSMDEVMEKGDNIHLEQNINSNGLKSSLEGYYYDGKLYSSYNGITYYEEMDSNDIKQALLFPIDPYLFNKDDIKKIDMGNDEDNYLTFILEIKKDKALELFLSRYDIYGLNGLNDIEVKENQIIYRFDGDDYLKENTKFILSSKSNNEELDIIFTMNVNYFFINDTEVLISEDKKEEHKEYVYYQDIDVNNISEIIDDEIGESNIDTFKNRIVSRLGYEAVEGKDNIYRTEYNENEVYTIDFNNNTFVYTNYSIDYSYSWKGDIGSMGKCTFDYKKDISSSECNETTIDTLKRIKTYLEMELYYCGLTMDDIIEKD